MNKWHNRAMPRRKKYKSSKLADLLKNNPLSDFVYHNPEIKTFLYILIIVSAFSLLGVFRIGSVTIYDDNTLTVMGTFSTQEYNRVATYIVSASEIGTEKDSLINTLNNKTIDITEASKDFGVDHVDIKTTNNYIYKVQDPEILKRYRTNQEVWKAGSSIEIKLRELNKTGDFTILLTGFSNTELFGPNYSLDEKDLDEAMLLSEAVENAKEKATYLADDQNKRLGKIVSIEEISGLSFRSYGDVLGLGSGGSFSEHTPGATKVTKTVRVKFKLR